MAFPRFVRNGAALVLVLACCACATPANETPANQTASEEPRSDKAFRTGSRIPVKDPESTSAKALNTQAVQDSMMQGAHQGVSPKGQ